MPHCQYYRVFDGKLVMNDETHISPPPLRERSATTGVIYSACSLPPCGGGAGRGV
jgi:hypothetical protein